MDEYARSLLEAIDAVVAGWVARCVTTLAEQQGLEVDDDVHRAIAVAGDDARAEVATRLRILFDTDVDEQRTNPLDILRRAVVHPTRVLEGLGARPVRRDEFAERVFPADIYGLSPATWADVDPSLTDPGIVWGASKAQAVLARRRAEGRI